MGPALKLVPTGRWDKIGANFVVVLTGPTLGDWIGSFTLGSGTGFCEGWMVSIVFCNDGGRLMARLSNTAVDAMAERRLVLVCRNGRSGVGLAKIDRMSSVAWTRVSASDVVGNGVL